jgi:hypothetical protein
MSAPIRLNSWGPVRGDFLNDGRGERFRFPGRIALGYAALLSAAFSLASSSLESDVFSTRGL